MKHLDPVQIEAAARQQPKKKSSLPWVLSVLAITTALGAAGTYFFAPNVQDQVTDQEKQERQIAFTKVRTLQAIEVEADKVDAALDEMRLPPPERAQMRAMLPAGGATQQPSTPPTGNVAPPPVAPLPGQDKPLRLVSISLWDTHAPDGDVVAIVSAGYRREIVLTKAEQMITFPVDQAATVQVVGVRDGGGGITVGIRGPMQDILMPIMSEGQTLSLPVGR